MAHAFLSNRVVTPPRHTSLSLSSSKTAKSAQSLPPPPNSPADAIHPGLRQRRHPSRPHRHPRPHQRARPHPLGRIPHRNSSCRRREATPHTLIDMPLNCLPETTTVAALEAKRRAARNQCIIDWAPWGGAVADNQQHILPLARAGVLGYKCFLIYPGCDGFTMIDQQQLEAALPAIAASGLPLLVHAELVAALSTAQQQPHSSANRRLAQLQHLPSITPRRSRDSKPSAS